MDPVSLIVTALAAGAAAATEKSVTSAVTDAYQGLKALVRARFGERRDGRVALDRLDEDPDDSVPMLTTELGKAGTDTTMTQAAERLMTLLDTGDTRRYKVDARNSMGAQIGDNNTQTNTFNLPSSNKGYE